MTEKVRRVPEALEGHMHVQGYAHAQDRPESSLVSHGRGGTPRHNGGAGQRTGDFVS